MDNYDFARISPNPLKRTISDILLEPLTLLIGDIPDE